MLCVNRPIRLPFMSHGSYRHCLTYFSPRAACVYVTCLLHSAISRNVYANTCLLHSAIIPECRVLTNSVCALNFVVNWAKFSLRLLRCCRKCSVVKLRLVPPAASRLRLKCDGTGAETRFHLSAKRTSPFKSAGASVQSTTGSRSVRISGSNGSNAG
jgi:hypothetical protein